MASLPPYKSQPNFKMGSATIIKYSCVSEQPSSASNNFTNALIPPLSEAVSLSPLLPNNSQLVNHLPTQDTVSQYCPPSTSQTQPVYLTTKLSTGPRKTPIRQYTNSQVLRGQWLLEQRKKEPIHPPTIIWAIGIIDVLSVISSTALVVYDVFFQKAITDLESHIWQFFEVSVFIVMQLVMGIGLITGLRSMDESSTLWYCKMWICCQYFFLLYSISFLFFGGILLARLDGSSRNKIMYVVESVRFAYRVACLIVVKEFKDKLDKSQKIFEDAWQQQQDGPAESTETQSINNGQPVSPRNNMMWKCNELFAEV